MADQYKAQRRVTAQMTMPSSQRVSSWAWLAVLAAGAGAFESLRHTVIATGNPNLVPALILVGAAAIPLAFTVFILGRSMPFEVTGGVLSIMAICGGVVGIVVASSLEYDSQRDLGALPSVGVAGIEETAKLLVPVAFLLLKVRRHHIAPADGLLIGVASGAGFAALETMGYAFVALIDTRGNVSAVDGVLALRGLLSPAAHMAWTGLSVAALWSAAAAGWTSRSRVRLASAYLLAVGLHTAWDSVATLGAYFALAGVGLASLAYASARLRAQKIPR